MNLPRHLPGRKCLRVLRLRGSGLQGLGLIKGSGVSGFKYVSGLAGHQPEVLTLPLFQIRFRCKAYRAKP